MNITQNKAIKFELHVNHLKVIYKLMKIYIKFKLYNEIATLVCSQNMKSVWTVKIHLLANHHQFAFLF